jgi:hypothetical protein
MAVPSTRRRRGATGVPPWEHIGRVGLDLRSFPPWDGRSPLSHPTCDVPFPPRRTGGYRKGILSDPPFVPGFRRPVWDPETSREWISDWDGPDGLGPLVCCRQGVPQGQWESGGIVLAVHAGARAPRGGVTRQGVVLTDLQSLLDCQ